MTTDRNGLEMLTRTECLHLLKVGRIGRIGMSGDGLPTVLPVNYFFDGDRILIVTSVGSKLNAALGNKVVAFELDEFDLAAHSGWSVVAVGVARAVHDAQDLARIRELPVTRWAPRGDWYVVAISVDWISGRRMPKPGPSAGEWYPPHELHAAEHAAS